MNESNDFKQIYLLFNQLESTISSHKNEIRLEKERFEKLQRSIEQHGESQCIANVILGALLVLNLFI
jgi:peptidoglycan hydrolase CwlO-like protein